ncbi:hypothetical protein [Methylobacterium sp. J-077]|uniref:hypothetical protein n=1 Tax=Methylobacterium sp. J-077 TaxID=2836656 RepID=UPI001FB87647|nr:hypothetical protein [Methylobacterium sp. J-077]MCJ2125166.1 hypothetical protein [Methylobacterium sp. J-077]
MVRHPHQSEEWPKVQIHEDVDVAVISARNRDTFGRMPEIFRFRKRTRIDTLSATGLP